MSGRRPSGGNPLAAPTAILIIVGAVVGGLAKGGVLLMSSPRPEAPAATAAAPRAPTVPGSTGKGKVTFHAGANLPGKPLTPFTMAFLQRVANIYGGEMVVSYGTAGDHGERSYHYGGHAADFGMPTNHSVNDSPVGDRMMRACLIAGGMAAGEATGTAQAGGLVHLYPPGMTVECIWKTDEGGNHHDHVHAAAIER